MNVENKFYNEFLELNNYFTDFNVIENKSDYIEITGVFNLDAAYQNVHLLESFNLKIVVPISFPKKLPKVYVDVEAIPKGYEHSYDDGELCLGVESDIWDKFYTKPTLIHFTEIIIIGNLYSIAYFARYGEFPFGERRHGVLGVIDFYYEKFGIDDIGALLRILEIIANGKYRGHLPCPCDSQKPTGKCHGVKIMEAINSHYADVYSRDFKLIENEPERIRLKHERKSSPKRYLRKSS